MQSIFPFSCRLLAPIVHASRHRNLNKFSLLILLPLQRGTTYHGNNRSWYLREKNWTNTPSQLMESLINQTRARFSSKRRDNIEASSSTRDTEIPLQKTESFKGKKRSQSWIRRQFSRQMSRDYDINGSDYPTAVAAAAYAVHSLEESEDRDTRDITHGPDKPKSRVEDTEPLTEPLKSALEPTDGTSKISFKDPDHRLPSKKIPEKAPSIKKKISFADTNETTGDKPGKARLDDGPERAPSMRKPPSFALNATDSQKPETTVPMLDRPSTEFMAQLIETRRPQSATKPGPADSEADAWEKEKLASIKDRYEKLRATADNWEMKKKKKARSKLERTEAELSKRREKAVKSHHSEISRIEEIAGGARAKAEDMRRNEEFKAKEKANKIRSTGKLPATCLCF